KIDAKQYAGHKITFYEQLYPGDKPSDKVKPIVEHKDKNDAEETFAVKDTPKKPKKITPKHFLPHTGEEKALWSVGGLGLLLLGFAVWQRDKIKNLFNKKQK
ncbi:LPXTG cell wall anchor domain-containing protein, partial [Lactococcus garvieae]|uniref:LPXTG cell wall anchor domain-containing protein n=1 Tax=Lactococcus garvieae TaxID=1363 RepID=UPI003D76FFF2